MKWNPLSLVCVGVMTLAQSAFAASPATAPAAKDFSAEVSKFAHQLGVDDPIDVQAGLIGLGMEPVIAFPAIQKAAQDPSLSPKAATRLKEFIAKQQPLIPARQRIWVKTVKYQEASEASALAAYNQAGKKNPKWDDDAREGIRKFLAFYEPREVALKSLDKAINAGCDDPFILYIRARSMELVKSTDHAEIQRTYDRAVAGMTGAYPPNRRLYCLLRSFVHLRQMEFDRTGPGGTIDPMVIQRLADMLDQVHTIWPEYLKGDTVDTETWELAAMVTEGVYNLFPRKVNFDQIWGPLQMKHPDSRVALLIQGAFYVQYAWDARGRGWANQVTPEGANLMQERLEIAEKALTKAWEMDKTDPTAAVEMIRVELGQGKGRDRMELWFKRAMDADPDSIAACNLKLLYLEPKWYGSMADVIGFAHECFETQSWRSTIPLLRARVISDLLPSVDEEALLADPSVWADLTAVYEPWLRYKPDNAFSRSRYCFFAARTGHWDIARQQFEMLGDKADPKQFGTAAAMKALHDTAYEKGRARHTGD